MNNWPWIEKLLRLEAALRTGRGAPASLLHEAELPEYWLQVLKLLVFYRRHVVDGEPLDHDFFVGIWRPYRRLLRRRRPAVGATEPKPSLP